MPDRRRLATGVAVGASIAVLPVTVARVAGGGGRFPAPLLAAATPFAALALLPAVALALAGRPRRLAALPGALALLHLAWLAPSLAPDGGPADQGGAAWTTSSIRLTVMTSNAYLGQADAAALVAAVDRFGVDVLAVEELTPALVGRLRAAGLEQRLPYAVLRPGPGGSGTGLWTRSRPDPLPPLTGTSFATPRLRLPVGAGYLTVTAAHPQAPRPGAVGRWEADLRALHDGLAASAGPQLVAGDFNATRDHGPFRRLLDLGLVDAADARGWHAWPGTTWPNDRWFPPLLRLDHVLASPPVAVDDVRVVDVPGSDHRALVARLRLR